MNSISYTKNDTVDVLQIKGLNKGTSENNNMVEVFSELERGVYAALETYSNVHRGSGHNSMVTTQLYEQARGIVLEYLGLKKGKYVVIFCTPRRASILISQLEPNSFQCISSKDIGLSIGIRALAVKRKDLPAGIPFQTGGGTAKLMSKDWIIWDDAPDKFEAGTPPIINVIAFARALSLIQRYGKEIFKVPVVEKITTVEILYKDELEKFSGRVLLDALRQTHIGRGICVPTLEGKSPFINLDNSASTPTFTPIWNAFRQIWRQTGQVQQDIIYEVREICSKALGAPLAEFNVIFTSNTTEAINMVTESIGLEPLGDIEPVLLITLLEHSSNDLPWRMVPHHSLIRLSVDTEGFMDLNELETLLCSYNQKNLYGRKRIKLVAVSGASNVLGICNNIEEISRIVHQFGARLLVDAAQLVAHRKVDMEESGIDYLAFSAHKVYAPFGCGVLLVRKGLLNFTSPEMVQIQTSGEENIAGITALGKALVLLQRIGMNLIQEEEQALTKRTLQGLTQINGLKIYGIRDPESPGFANKIGVIVFLLGNRMSNRVAKELALRSGIGVRYGCHCSHILVKRILNISPFLEQIQWFIQTLFPKVRLPGVVRVSLGIENTEEEVDKLIQVLIQIARRGNKSDSEINGTLKLSSAKVQMQIKDFIRSTALEIYTQP